MTDSVLVPVEICPAISRLENGLKRKRSCSPSARKVRRKKEQDGFNSEEEEEGEEEEECEVDEDLEEEGEEEATPKRRKSVSNAEKKKNKKPTARKTAKTEDKKALALQRKVFYHIRRPDITPDFVLPNGMTAKHFAVEFQFSTHQSRSSKNKSKKMALLAVQKGTGIKTESPMPANDV